MLFLSVSNVFVDPRGPPKRPQAFVLRRPGRRLASGLPTRALPRAYVTEKRGLRRVHRGARKEAAPAPVPECPRLRGSKTGDLKGPPPRTQR